MDGGDGEKERERGKGERRRTEYDVRVAKARARGTWKVRFYLFLCFFVVIEVTMLERQPGIRSSLTSRARWYIRAWALYDKRGETEGAEHLDPRLAAYERARLPASGGVFVHVRDFFRSHSAPESQLARIRLPTTRLRRWGLECE
jgi:hypothetical protein